MALKGDEAAEAIENHVQNPCSPPLEFSTHGIYIMVCVNFFKRNAKEDICYKHEKFFDDNMDICPEILRQGGSCRKITDIYKVGITSVGMKRYENEVRPCSISTPNEDQWIFASWYGYNTSGSKKGNGITCVAASDNIRTVEGWLKYGHTHKTVSKTKTGKIIRTTEDYYPFFSQHRRPDGLGGTELIYNLKLSEIREMISRAFHLYHGGFPGVYVPAIPYLRYFTNMWNPNEYRRHFGAGKDSDVSVVDPERAGVGLVKGDHKKDGVWFDKEKRRLWEFIDDPEEMTADQRKQKLLADTVLDAVSGDVQCVEVENSLEQQISELERHNKFLQKYIQNLEKENARLKKELETSVAASTSLSRKRPNSPRQELNKDKIKF